MKENFKSSTGLSEVKNTGLKSVFEEILYVKVYGTIQRQGILFGPNSVGKSIKTDKFYNEIFTNDNFYGEIRSKLYTKVIRRVVDKAQNDYLNSETSTYVNLTDKFEKIAKEKKNANQEVFK